MEASHPVPDAAGVAAGQRILALAADAGPDDLVIALLSGGGSALLEAPAAGVTLAEIQAMTSALLACGATIGEINCLRKHCSALKGGQLARAVSPATLVTLVLSDVVGSPLDVIASGPTVPDRSTWADAWAVVERYGLESVLPSAIVARLRAGLAGALPDTPKPAISCSQLRRRWWSATIEVQPWLRVTLPLHLGTMHACSQLLLREKQRKPQNLLSPWPVRCSPAVIRRPAPPA